MTTTQIVYTNRAAALRAKILGQAVPPPKLVEVKDGDEVMQFYVRSPVLKERHQILERAGLDAKRMVKEAQAAKKGKKGQADDEVEGLDIPIPNLMAAAVIALAQDEVGQPIFTDADFDVILNSRVGSWIEQLAAACLNSVNGGGSEAGKE